MAEHPPEDFEFDVEAWNLDEQKWRAERLAAIEIEWRQAVLDVLRDALSCYDADPHALHAVPRLLNAARLAVS